MPFSHHSHSGQFCPEHARDSLEEMVKAALALQFRVFACTEHMPRHEDDFYPGELELGLTLQKHIDNQSNYVTEARRLQDKYKNQIEILVGFESEWIRPTSLDLIQNSLRTHKWDLLVGSVHHVHTVPIDFDREYYLRARRISGGSDSGLFGDYFDAQYAMLQAIKPPVVGHFDLIRLFSDAPDLEVAQDSLVSSKMQRNLGFVASYGGLLELNFSALRKGMREPYPQAATCKRFSALGGRFCLSDDSHGMDQVGLNYDKVLPFLVEAEITKLHFLRTGQASTPLPLDLRFPHIEVSSIEVNELAEISH